MKRLPALFALLLFACPAFGQDTQLHITGGDSVVVKIDKVVIVKEDRLVVRSLPFKVNATPGAADYRWSFPAGVTATESDDVLNVTAAPKGEITVSCRVLVVDFDAKATKRTTQSLTFNVGDVTPPVPPPPPIPPIPPVPSALQQSLQAAYTADADPDGGPKIAALADVLANAVATAKASGKITTAPAFAAYVHQACELHPQIGPGALPKTRAAVGVYLNANLIRTGPADTAYWAKAASEYGFVALALKAVK